MAGEAVTGRYSAARHAAVDEGGARRHPDSDDRSLVDRLLAGADDDQGFDWGWGEPAGREAPEREPLHDIPELWEGRSGPDLGNRGEREDERFPTPRLHAESSRDDAGATDDRDDDRADDRERLAQDRPVDDRDWSDRGRDDLGSDDWRADDRGSDGRGGDELGSDELGSDDRGSDDRGSDDWGSDDRGGDDRAGDDRAGDDRGSDDRGGPAPVFESRRSNDRPPGPGLFDEPEPRDRGFENRYEDRSLDDRQSGDQRFGFDADPLDALSTGRVRAEASPFADGLRDGDTPRRDPLDDVPMDGDHPGPRQDQQDRDELGPPSPAQPRPSRDVLDGIGRKPADELRDGADGAPEPAHHVLLGRGALSGEPSEPDRPRPRGAGPADAERPPSDELRRPDDRPDVDRDEQAPERRERKLADPRLRRWADRNRPSGPPRDGGDRPSAPPPSGPVPFADEQPGPGPFGSDRRGADEGDADPFGPADLFEPDGRDRPDAPRPRAADTFGDDPALTESARTGRIHIGDAGAAAPDEPPFDRGPDPRDAAPDPTAVFGAVAPAGSARRAAPEEPALPLEEYAARRRAAEQAAASAEQAAASAAERASAAIAAAARAAEEAEAAAEIAAQAAAKANEAADAESRAIADSAARGSLARDEAPARPDERGEAPEAPTQAVPLIAPSRGGRRPPPRRPAGPPPRGARPDEPARGGGPQPRGGPRGGPARDGAHPGGSDGEATTVLTGLDALRDPVRPRTPEPAQAPAEMTTVTRRRPAVEQPPHADDVDDADDAELDDEPEENGLIDGLRSRPVVAAVGVGAVLVLAAIVAFFTTSEPEATPAEPAPAALSAPAAPQPPAAPEIDPNSEKAVAFLTAMRDADIPTSSTGQAETEAAAAICTQLDQGANDAQIARRVPTVLPDVTRSQASDVVGFAKKLYC